MGYSMTARFAEHDRKRRVELDCLIAAGGNDLSMVWQEALNRLADKTADRTEPVMV